MWTEIPPARPASSFICPRRLSFASALVLQLHTYFLVFRPVTLFFYCFVRYSVDETLTATSPFNSRLLFYLAIFTSLLYTHPPLRPLLLIWGTRTAFMTSFPWKNFSSYGAGLPKKSHPSFHPWEGWYNGGESISFFTFFFLA